MKSSLNKQFSFEHFHHLLLSLICLSEQKEQHIIKSHMAKSFKLRLSKVINMTLQSCRSKDPSDLPEEPVPPLFRLSPNSKLVTVDFPVSQLTSRMKAAAGNHQLRRMSSSDPTISSAFIRSYSSSREFKWEKEEKWHVIAKIYDESHTAVPRKKKASSNTKNVEQLALPPPVPTKPSSSSSHSRRKKRHEKSKKIPINTFSPEFSNEVGDEQSAEVANTLVANFFIDPSMEFGYNMEAIINRDQTRPTTSTRRHKRSKRKPKKRSTESTTTTHSVEIIHRQSSVSSTAEMGSSPARLSIFKKWIPCSVDGKMKESFAFVKKSEDPYEDFKRSMMEMILEKQIFEQEELEKLLQCFLSLNSTQYHILIFKAFSEISETMFAGSSRNSIHDHSRVSSRS